MIRILIVEDMVLLQESLTNAINAQEDMEVAGVAANADDAPALCRELKPDLALIDVVTDNKANGIAAAEKIRVETPDVKVVIMTALPEITFVDAARKAGAHSFVYKSSVISHVLYVIRSTMEGMGIYPGPKDECFAKSHFTDAEIAVIRLVCQGKQLNEVTKSLSMAEDSVMKLMSGILNKTGFDSITKFSIYAVAHGFVVPDNSMSIERNSHTSMEESAAKIFTRKTRGHAKDQYMDKKTRDSKFTIKKLFYALLLTGGLALLFAFQSDIWRANQKKIVTLTIWHTYVEQMSDSFNALIQEFNDTVGAKEGITVSVAAEANESSLNEMLLASVKSDPGAPARPDMALVYPRIAIELKNLNALADLGTLFTKNELDLYVPEFLDEGMLGGDTLFILPIAKSTEVLYVNRTFFDRFARDAGIDISLLATFEGILQAADMYYEWTDAQTPHIPGDGKTFYYPDLLFNYVMTGFGQMGDNFVKDFKLNLNSHAFKRIWDSYFPNAVRGRVAIFDKYSNYLAMTGEIVCATSTTAGASFYPKSVIYADNTKEDVFFDVLPFPVFEGGERLAAQRGAGMCVLKSDKEKESAAAFFLKWLTEPAQNTRFSASTGYMPVTKEAFDLLLNDELEGVENEYVRKALKTTVAMKKNYRFFVPPMFEGFDALQRKLVTRLIATVKDAKEEYKRLLENNPRSPFDFEAQFQAFIEDF